VLRQIVKDVWTWSWRSPEKGYAFNGTVLAAGQERVLVDPAVMSDEERGQVEALGPFQAIYLTNKDHERTAYDLRRDWKIPVAIHEKDKPFLKEAPDHVFREGERLACGLEVLHLPDQKSPGECAFYARNRGLLILGDALIGVPAGRLNLLPAAKYKDAAKARLGLERLRALFFEIILVGDGEPVLVQAHDILEQFFLKEKLAAVQGLKSKREET
jgi:glyoxylase-like metal-dependent hydrolase (beta-lactamase superfamily II)